MVSSSPSAADHPHRFGVRLGKCQAIRKVTLASPPAGTDCVTAIELTGIRPGASGVSAPSAVKSSQKDSAPSHHWALFQPRRQETLPGGAPRAHSATEPLSGSEAPRKGLSINRPLNPD